MPPLVIYNPLFAYETGDDFVRAWFDAAAGKLDPCILVLEGSVPNEEIDGDGCWAAFGVDPQHARADPHLRVDRPAGAPSRGDDCDRHLRAYGGIPAMRNNPTGAMGLRNYLGGLDVLRSACRS